MVASGEKRNQWRGVHKTLEDCIDIAGIAGVDETGTNVERRSHGNGRWGV